MNLRNQNVVATLEGVVDWGGDHAVVPENARVVVLYGNIGTAAGAMRTYSTDQDSGGSVFHTETRTRREIAEAVLAQMRPINQMAKGLPRDLYPGVRGLFLMPKSNGYAALISRAESFLEAIGPVKAAFVERGLPADFDEQLAAALPGIGSSSQTRTLGRAEQIGGTAGIDAKASEGLRYLAELDSILSYRYRNDPALLAAWKSVRHVQQTPVRQAKAPAALTNASQPAVADPKATVTGSASRSNGHESSFGGVEPRINGTNGSLVA